MAGSGEGAVPGERIYRPGQKAHAVYFISSGEVEFLQDGQKVRLGPNDFFGEHELIHGGRRKARARASSFCHLLELSATDFQRLILDAPQLVGRFERLASDRLPSRDVEAEVEQNEEGDEAEMRYVTATPEPPFRIAGETRDRVSEER